MNKYLLFPILAVFLVGCKQDVLLKGLDQQQANEVIALLQRNNIKVDKNEIKKEGYSLSVSSQDFSASVDLMNTYGLPRPPAIDIAQMFPADALVSSPRAEKARLYSGIEQRLEHSLLSISGVVSAHVHVSYDMSSSDGDRRRSAVHISTLLNHDNSITDTTLLISDVKRFLKNSFEDVNYDNISVVLSKINDVQRHAPVSIQAAKSNTPTWLISLGVVTVALLAAMLLFISQRQHAFLDKLKKRVLTQTNNKTASDDPKLNVDVPEDRK
ncbi:type III secretion system inner membrane ring lipoprotein SctJ [Symbiopectobacterium purcellii]|uniref:Lipoprotein n=1 Tax=Symbiopectobacterium purcellii TaxID=2871826 RepID=A0ABX9AMT8_9ENTR|nr:type III secretion inner membrane ring lipoprotein SctJ [Symbiopectobacterium purcellii]QZN94794.1 type III secretion inner membrane ring lipoprotein SctJ [Symbiopectobacterium purcellii]